MLHNFLNFIIEHAIAIGLVLSEVLAFFPSKYTGLIKSLWKIAESFATRKK